MTDADIKKMFMKHKIDEHRINYKDFMFDIRSFNFAPEKIYVTTSTWPFLIFNRW